MTETEAIVEQMLKTIQEQAERIHSLEAEVLILIDENEILFDLLHGQ